MEALEKENSDLKKNLIASMDETTSLKEKVKTLDDDLRVERKLTQEKDEQLLSAKEKLKTIAARSVEAFQTTDEYNTVLFSWYFKGFELLMRYLVKLGLLKRCLTSIQRKGQSLQMRHLWECIQTQIEFL